MDNPAAPEDPDTPDEVTTGEGSLGQLTDEAWLASHQRLIASGVLPAAETDYEWSPGEPA